MIVCPVVSRIATIALAEIVGIHGAVGIDSLSAVALPAIGALRTVFLQTASGLSANTYTVADLDVRYVLAYTNCFADDLMAYAASYDR